VPSLQRLAASGHDVALVVTQPDRPGHRMRLTPPPVKVAAHALGMVVYQPERIRDPEVGERLRGLKPDLLVVVAYGQLIPAAVLAIPKHGALNVHASLLPRHRGAAPVAHAILAGDEETGVTIMRVDEKMDHGPVLAVRATPIGAGEDAVGLTSRLAEMGAELLVETIAKLDEIVPRAQDHERATLAPRLSRKDGELGWDMSPREIDRRVRAFQPWPGVTLPDPSGERMKVLSGRVEAGRYVPERVQTPGRRAREVRGNA
jgi:methionyl-tRNA formyltransferase